MGRRWLRDPRDAPWNVDPEDDPGPEPQGFWSDGSPVHDDDDYTEPERD